MPADEPGCAGHNDTSAHASTLWEILEVVQRRAPDCSARWVIRLLTVLQQEGRIDEVLIRRSPFSQERTRTPRERPAYPLTPTYPIAGETDWIITVVELSKVTSDPGEHRSIPHFLNTLGVEISQDLNTIRIHTTGNDPAIPEH